MPGTTPPVLEGAPTAKQKKYDRQLRLWAASGQQALEEARVLLINSGPGVVGLETLKNLVLPGIGNFTILDSAIVQEADLGVNFFLEDGNICGLRAEHTCNYLKELNPDVEGHSITEPIESFITKPDALKPYTLILVASPIDPEILSRIVQHSHALGVPLFLLHSVGFYIHFSLQLPAAFPIVDTHPDPESTTDLRLLKPWPELQQLAQEKTKELDSMDEEDHGHIPYILLLLHYLERWKDAHDGKPPQNYTEKNEFKALVTGATRTNNAEGGEENFEQAVGAVLKNFNAPEPSSAVKEVFKADESQNLSTGSANFWVIAHAIGQFYQKTGVLPLPGAVPDMKAKSADYIQLQTIYKNKARDDVAEVLGLVRQLEKQLGRPSAIEEREVEAFCKNAAHIKLVRGRPLQVIRPGEIVQWSNAKSSTNKLTDPDSGIHVHIAFLAYDSFCASHPANDQLAGLQSPGIIDTESDTEKVTGIAYKIIDDLINQAGRTIDDPEYSEIKTAVGKVCQEIVRAAGGELHNISALAGGLVAQEVIKVITKQYIPVDNTCVFDGIHSKSAVFMA